MSLVPLPSVSHACHNIHCTADVWQYAVYVCPVLQIDNRLALDLLYNDAEICIPP